MHIDEYVPKVLPPFWEEVTAPPVMQHACGIDGCRAFARVVPPMKLFLSLDRHGSEAGTWLHLSLSHVRRLPSWQELCDVKDLFFGDVPAVQLLPPKKHYLNVHPNCLHLFRRLDGPSVPDVLWRLP